eukprot:COSAG01_NODE_1300_length_10830_cov_25.036716_1_plen_84_part_00
MTAECEAQPQSSPWGAEHADPGHSAQLEPLWGLRCGDARAGPSAIERGCPSKSGAAEPRGKAPALAFEMKSWELCRRTAHAVP